MPTIRKAQWLLGLKVASLLSAATEPLEPLFCKGFSYLVLSYSPDRDIIFQELKFHFSIPLPPASGGGFFVASGSKHLRLSKIREI